MEISPAILEFKPPFTKTSTETLTLHNTSDVVLAFKVKTTAPKLYCVRPNASTVEPGQKLNVKIILQGLKSEPEPDYKCKDKFLVVTLPCPEKAKKDSIAQSWQTLEAKYKPQIVNKKIRVIFKTQSATGTILKPKKDEVPIAKKVSTLSVTDETTMNDSIYSSTESPAKKTEDKDLSESKKKIDQLDAKLSSNAAAADASSSSASQVEPAQSSGTPLPMVILVALLALIIAWLFF